MISNKCMGREELIDYLQGFADQKSAAKVEQHVETCRTCEEVIEGLEDSVEGCRVDGLEGLSRVQSLDTFSEQKEIDQAVQLIKKQSITDPKNDSLFHLDLQSNNTLKAGENLGNYRLEKLVGSGAMAAVFQATHQKLNKKVAIKILSTAGYSKNPIDRIERELQAIGNLDHPSIVAATDAGEDKGVRFLVTELIDGLDLKKVIDREHKIETSDACQIIRQAAQGLAVAHRQGFVHRDVKPSNIMLDKDGKVKILDFGLVSSGQEGTDNLELTTVGQLLGTLDYMSPEQAENANTADHRSDVYSLAATLFCLLTGRAPYAMTRHQSPLEKLRLLANHNPPKIKTLLPELPQKLADLIDGSLSRCPANRAPSAIHLAEKLEPYCKNADLESLILSAVSKPQPQYDVFPAAVTVGASSLNKIQNGSGGRFKNFWRVAAGMLFAAFAYLSIILIIQTQQGELVIKSDTANVSAKILKDGKVYKTIKIKPGNHKTMLYAGKYEIEIDSPSSDIQIDQNTWNLKRGDIVVATITRGSTQEEKSVKGKEPKKTVKNEQRPDSFPTMLKFDGKTLEQWFEIVATETSDKRSRQAADAIMTIASRSNSQELKKRIINKVFSLPRNKSNFFPGYHRESVFPSDLNWVVRHSRASKPEDFQLISNWILAVHFSSQPSKEDAIKYGSLQLHNYRRYCRSCGEGDRQPSIEFLSIPYNAIAAYSKINEKQEVLREIEALVLDDRAMSSSFLFNLLGSWRPKFVNNRVTNIAGMKLVLQLVERKIESVKVDSKEFHEFVCSFTESRFEFSEQFKKKVRTKLRLYLKEAIKKPDHRLLTAKWKFPPGVGKRALRLPFSPIIRGSKGVLQVVLDINLVSLQVIESYLKIDNLLESTDRTLLRRFYEVVEKKTSDVIPLITSSDRPITVVKLLFGSYPPVELNLPNRSIITGVDRTAKISKLLQKKNMSEFFCIRLCLVGYDKVLDLNLPAPIRPKANPNNSKKKRSSNSFGRKKNSKPSDSSSNRKPNLENQTNSSTSPPRIASIPSYNGKTMGQWKKAYEVSSLDQSLVSAAEAAMKNFDHDGKNFIQYLFQSKASRSAFQNLFSSTRQVPNESFAEWLVKHSGAKTSEDFQLIFIWLAGHFTDLQFKDYLVLDNDAQTFFNLALDAYEKSLDTNISSKNISLPIACIKHLDEMNNYINKFPEHETVLQLKAKVRSLGIEKSNWKLGQLYPDIGFRLMLKPDHLERKKTILLESLKLRLKNLDPKRDHIQLAYFLEAYKTNQKSFDETFQNTLFEKSLDFLMHCRRNPKNLFLQAKLYSPVSVRNYFIKSGKEPGVEIKDLGTYLITRICTLFEDTQTLIPSKLLKTLLTKLEPRATIAKNSFPNRKNLKLNLAQAANSRSEFQVAFYNQSIQATFYDLHQPTDIEKAYLPLAFCILLENNRNSKNFERLSQKLSDKIASASQLNSSTKIFPIPTHDGRNLNQFFELIQHPNSSKETQLGWAKSIRELFAKSKSEELTKEAIGKAFETNLDRSVFNIYFDQSNPIQSVTLAHWLLNDSGAKNPEDFDLIFRWLSSPFTGQNTTKNVTLNKNDLTLINLSLDAYNKTILLESQKEENSIQFGRFKRMIDLDAFIKRYPLQEETKKIRERIRRAIVLNSTTTITDLVSSKQFKQSYRSTMNKKSVLFEFLSKKIDQINPVEDLSDLAHTLDFYRYFEKQFDEATKKKLNEKLVGYLNCCVKNPKVLKFRVEPTWRSFNKYESIDCDANHRINVKGLHYFLVYRVILLINQEKELRTRITQELKQQLLSNLKEKALPLIEEYKKSPRAMITITRSGIPRIVKLKIPVRIRKDGKEKIVNPKQTQTPKLDSAGQDLIDFVLFALINDKLPVLPSPIDKKDPK